MKFSPEHSFLMSCSTVGDFSTQYRKIFQKESIDHCQLTVERIDSLCRALLGFGRCENPLLRFNPSTLNYIFDGSFLDRYRSFDSYLEGSNFNEFEDICALCTKVLGLKSAATRRANDQGIDFIAVEPLLSDQILSTKTTDSLVIGQAKFYSDPIGTGDLRALHGSVDLARKGIFSGDELGYELLNGVKPYTDIRPVFMTSSRYSSDALYLADKVGIKLYERSKLIAIMTNLVEVFNSKNELDSNAMGHVLLNTSQTGLA